MIENEAKSATCSVCHKEKDETYPFFLPQGLTVEGHRICSGCRRKESVSWQPCIACERVFILLRDYGCPVEGGHTCPACANPGKAVCEKCEQWKDKENTSKVEVGRNWLTICTECADSIIKCAGCEVRDFPNHFNRFGDNRDAGAWCADCYEVRYCCCVCRTVHKNNETTGLEVPEGVVCKACFDERYMECTHCDNPVERYRVVYLPEDDSHENPMCMSCYARATHDRVTPEHRAQGHIFNYTFNVPRGLGILPKPGKRLYGIELEVCVNDSTLNLHEIAASVYKHSQNKVVIKSDSSISYGFEIVTAPLADAEIKELLSSILKGTKGLLNEHSSCGMHVHVSRASLTRPQLAKMIRFLHTPGNKNFVEWIAGRKHNTYASLAARHWKDAGIFGESTRNFDGHTRSSQAISERYLPRLAQTLSGEGRMPWMNGGRYQAINLCNRDTIEFRIFATSVKAERANANFDFCRALVDFTGEMLPLKEQTSVAKFIGYVRDRKAMYPDLTKRFQEEADKVALLEAGKPIPSAKKNSTQDVTLTQADNTLAPYHNQCRSRIYSPDRGRDLVCTRESGHQRPHIAHGSALAWGWWTDEENVYHVLRLGPVAATF